MLRRRRAGAAPRAAAALLVAAAPPGRRLLSAAESDADGDLSDRDYYAPAEAAPAEESPPQEDISDRSTAAPTAEQTPAAPPPGCTADGSCDAGHTLHAVLTVCPGVSPPAAAEAFAGREQLRAAAAALQPPRWVREEKYIDMSEDTQQDVYTVSLVTNAEAWEMLGLLDAMQGCRAEAAEARRTAALSAGGDKKAAKGAGLFATVVSVQRQGGGGGGAEGAGAGLVAALYGDAGCRAVPARWGWAPVDADAHHNGCAVLRPGGAGGGALYGAVTACADGAASVRLCGAGCGACAAPRRVSLADRACLRAPDGRGVRFAGACLTDSPVLEVLLCDTGLAPAHLRAVFVEQAAQVAGIQPRFVVVLHIRAVADPPPAAPPDDVPPCGGGAVAVRFQLLAQPDPAAAVDAIRQALAGGAAGAVLRAALRPWAPNVTEVADAELHLPPPSTLAPNGSTRGIDPPVDEVMAGWVIPVVAVAAVLCVCSIVAVVLACCAPTPQERAAAKWLRNEHTARMKTLQTTEV